MPDLAALRSLRDEQQRVFQPLKGIGHILAQAEDYLICSSMSRHRMCGGRFMLAVFAEVYLLSFLAKALLLAAGSGMGKTVIAREIARRMEANREMLLGTLLQGSPCDLIRLTWYLTHRDTLHRLQVHQCTGFTQGDERNLRRLARAGQGRKEPTHPG
jgi:hypothetical protein